MGAKNKKAAETASLKDKIMTAVGTALCIILLPILAINITLIIKSYTNTDEVPSVGGYLPLIVLTDSMYPYIESGDLIICHTIPAADVKEGDVIAFFDPEGNGTSIVTHRVIEVTADDAGLAFKTKGDANNVEDSLPVPAKSLVGIYRSRIAGAGNVAMFMQTSTGLIVCVVLPLLLLVGYDVIRSRAQENKKQRDTDALLAELEALKAEKAAKETSEK
jgi:signal peptidase